MCSITTTLESDVRVNVDAFIETHGASSRNEFLSVKLKVHSFVMDMLKYTVLPTHGVVFHGIYNLVYEFIVDPLSSVPVEMESVCVILRINVNQ